MKIMTSYFAMAKKIPKDFVQVSICLNTPMWFNGKEYDKLAPKWSFFEKWKYETRGYEDLYHNNEYFVREFNELVLGDLDIKEVVHDLKKLSKGKNICLMCYEKPSEFCHRHLVAQWMIDQMKVQYDKDVTVNEMTFN